MTDDFLRVLLQVMDGIQKSRKRVGDLVPQDAETRAKLGEVFNDLTMMLELLTDYAQEKRLPYRRWRESADEGEQ